ncbi:SCO2584 family spore wall biosynthesis protein [Streptomyces zhihengii]
MPDDVGGRPFPDGWEPDDDRGGADEDSASVVFDEDFVRAAEFHEPTAVERLLAAAEARAEADAARSGRRGTSADDDLYDGGYGPGRGHTYDDDHAREDPDGPYGRHGGALRPYRGSARWHRPVAWILALMMGIGMIALAFSAVYRGGSGGREDQVPQPARTGVDAPPTGATVSGRGSVPTATAGHGPPRVTAGPATP